jgi:hypothetical protein
MISKRDLRHSQNVISRAVRNFSKFNIPHDPPEHLDLLEYLVDEYKQSMPFANLDVVFIQHCLGPFIGRLNAMISCGLDPSRAWFVDIPYSTNEKVINKLKNMGFKKSQIAKKYDDPLSDYELEQKKRMDTIMYSVEKRKNPKRLLIYDDGGYFLRHLLKIHKENPKRLKNYFKAHLVEQTTRGHRELYGDALQLINKYQIASVSIARCYTKKKYEGPFIGAAVSRAFKNKIREKQIKNKRNIAVIGFGVVGEATVKEILPIFPDANIDVVDIDPETRAKINVLSKELDRNCQGVNELKEQKKYEIVFGCTGYNSFQLDQRDMLADGAILVSGSSAAIEFNRAGFVELAKRYDDDEIEIVDPEGTISRGIHADINMIQEGGKRFSFLNAGFPANFDGKLECLPQCVIQATHGLLFSAGVQILNQKEGGINLIDPDIDKKIFEMAVRCLAKEQI